MEKEPTKYSGGEWRISDWGGMVVITASKFPLLRGSEQVCDCSNSLKPKEEVLANAKLFVEAPETKEQRDDLMEVLLMLSRTAQGISAAQHAEVEIGAEMWSSLDCLNIQAKNLIDLCKGE